MPPKLTIAQRHFLRVQAAQQGAQEDVAEPTDAERMMRASLWADRRAIHDIKSMERKATYKAEVLPRYADYVAGVLEGDSGRDDEILMTVMVWRFDVRDLDGGLAIAEYALRHGLTTPDRFKRDTASLIAEEVAEQVLAILDARRETDQDGTDPEQLVAWAERAQALTEDADIHDPIRAKLAKAIGYALRAAGNESAALDYLKDAVRLYPQVGVKKDIERLQRKVDKQPDPDEEQPPADAEQASAEPTESPADAPGAG